MADVPCGGCTECCRRSTVFLYPELGDDPSLYETDYYEDPRKPGHKGLALKQKPDGSCVYVTDAGCSIHDKIPMRCREFDCRKLLWDFINKTPVMREGFRRLCTLTEATSSDS